MMTAMFLMAFDAVVIAAPISLQVLMLPFLYYEFHTVAPFIYCVFYVCLHLAMFWLAVLCMLWEICLHTNLRGPNSLSVSFHLHI